MYSRRSCGISATEDVARLNGLLKTTEVVQRHTSFQEIEESPKEPSLTHLEAVLDHLAWLESLGDVHSPLSGIPPALLQHFATEAKALHAGELREVQAPKRYTLLLCLIHRMRVRTRDDAAEMFVKRMDKIHRQARERLLEIQAPSDRRPRIWWPRSPASSRRSAATNQVSPRSSASARCSQKAVWWRHIVYI